MSGDVLIAWKTFVPVCIALFTLFASGFIMCKYLAKNWLLKHSALFFLLSKNLFWRGGTWAVISVYSSNLLIFFPLDLSYNCYSFCHAWLVIRKCGDCMRGAVKIWGGGGILLKDKPTSLSTVSGADFNASLLLREKRRYTVTVESWHARSPRPLLVWLH